MHACTTKALQVKGLSCFSLTDKALCNTELTNTNELGPKIPRLHSQEIHLLQYRLLFWHTTSQKVAYSTHTTVPFGHICFNQYTHSYSHYHQGKTVSKLGHANNHQQSHIQGNNYNNFYLQFPLYNRNTSFISRSP